MTLPVAIISDPKLSLQLLGFSFSH